jgi:hypothetical protein|tara:strand:- start:840 stop:1043 length:204 start_codon:yes stop_codon:yes gene_type:complete
MIKKDCKVTIESGGFIFEGLADNLEIDIESLPEFQLFYGYIGNRPSIITLNATFRQFNGTDNNKKEE